MRFRTILTGALTAALFAVLAVVAAQPASAANVFRIENLASGKCAQPDPSDPTGNAVAVVQRTCNGSAAQNWSPIHIGGTTYQFVNQGSGLCMWAGANANFAGVHTGLCTGASNTLWRYAPTIPSSVPALLRSLVGNSNGSRCLEPAGGSTIDMHLWIANCDLNAATMLWRIR